jgi:hypothetical protein
MITLALHSFCAQIKKSFILEIIRNGNFPALNPAYHGLWRFLALRFNAVFASFQRVLA